MKRALVALAWLPALAHADEITVQGSKPSTSAPAVGAEEAARIPGSQGDAGKSVLVLPGVGRGAFDSGDLIVWGSAPGDTRILVDGVEVPYFFHGSALRSVVPTRLVQSVSLIPGGFGPDLGRALGGVMRVKTAPLEDSVAAGADTLDGHAFGARTFGAHAAAVAGRYGWIDRLFGNSRHGDYVAIPRYGDWQGKASFVLREREELSLVILGARDDVRRVLPSGDPSAVRAERRTRGFHRGYLKYRRVLDDAELEATPFIGWDEDLTRSDFGDQPTDVETRALVYGLRTSYRTSFLVLGLDLAGSRARLARTGSLSVPSREGDATYFGRPPGVDVTSDTWTVHTLGVAPFVEAPITLGPVTLSPGVRVETHVFETSRTLPQVGTLPPVGDTRLEAAFDPRFSARVRATSRLTFTASVGRVHQPPNPQDLSAVFGTPALVSSSAWHAVLQGLWSHRGLSVEVTGFAKTMTDLPVRTRSPTPRSGLALVQDGEGRVLGGELLVRQKLGGGFFGWISYTLSRSERRYRGDTDWRLFDQDRTHVLAVVASKQLGQWTLGARYRFASGTPYADIVSSYQDLQHDRWEPVFGGQRRLPPFQALDLRVERALGPVTVSLDVMNATFRRNVEALAWSPDFQSSAGITGLPTIAILGAEVSL